MDDRKDGYGTKIKDAELIGIPINIIIGNKYLENGEIELKHRNGKSTVSQIAELSTIFDRFKK